MRRSLVVLSLVACALVAFPATTPAAQIRTSSHGPFFARSYVGTCVTLDFEPPPTETDPSPSSPVPVHMDDCAQPEGGPLPLNPRARITLTEVNSRHHVILQVGSRVLGTRSNVVAAGTLLELQTYTGAAGQVWSFDGDSFVLAANPNLVAEVQNGRTLNGTPIVLGRRDLDDSEFWTLQATDGTNEKPTSGFVRVPQERDFRTALDQATPGTVIEIADGVSIPLDDCTQVGACRPGQVIPDFPIRVGEGVTIRSDRRGTRMGADLSVTTFPDIYAILSIVGSRARITGVRLRGPSPSTADIPEEIIGVIIEDVSARWAIVDHNDVSGWTTAGVSVVRVEETVNECAPSEPDPSRTSRVVGNFLHHNARAGLGYGVSVGKNAFATILGNTFLYNRHAIAADGQRKTGYRAWSNLVLSRAPEYGWPGQIEHDFDMHGSDSGSHHTGGIAGSDVDIAWNTFLGTNPFGPDVRPNYHLRGVPCGLDRFRHNVSRQGQYDAVAWYGQVPSAPLPPWLEISDNKFSRPDPTSWLATGDFDGDGARDLFLATGAAWYYAPGGVAEWRHLNNQSLEMARLLFGDVDGDGRTDVLTTQGGTWLVSWGGLSALEPINQRDGAITDFAVGDFDGNGKADLFYSDGIQWLVSYGSVGPFTPLAYPWPKRVKDLRFGDFNGDGRTDIFAVIGDDWRVRYGAGYSAILRSALTASVADLVIADFDGNGRSDVARSDSTTWRVSLDGIGGWTTLRSSLGVPLKDAVAIGPFDPLAGDDVLAWELVSPVSWVWNGFFDVYSGGAEDPQRFSRWQMR